MLHHGSPQRQNCFSASQPKRLGLPPLPYLLAWRWSTPHATPLYEASHRSGATAFALISHAASGSRDTQLLPESCSDSAWSPSRSDHLFGGLLHLLPFSENVKLTRCKDCAFYEEFAPKRNGYWNKCALLDYYNLDPCSYHRCPYFVSAEPEYELFEEHGGGVVL